MTGARRRAPLPSSRTSAAPCASAVPATCLRWRKGNEGAPPLPTPNSHTHQGKGRGQRGDGEGTRGVTVAGSGPPPEDAAAEWGGSGTRVRDEPHDRAQREPKGNGGTAGGATAGRVG